MGDRAIRSAASAFDWEWADGYEEKSARSQALTNRRAETAALVSVVSADSIVNFGIGSSLPTNHPVSEMGLETQTDLLSTIYLAYGGFFRQAFTILRSWFELSVYGVYFSGHYGQPSSRYIAWRQGKRNAPANMHKISRSLAVRRSNVFKIGEHEFLTKLDPLYAVLSKHAHGEGLDVFDLQDGRDNVPRFLERSWDLWFFHVLSVFDAICFLYRIFFTEQLRSYLTSAQREQARAVGLARRLGRRVPEFKALIAQATR
jgi:hypothetical protein